MGGAKSHHTRYRSWRAKDCGHLCNLSTTVSQSLSHVFISTKPSQLWLIHSNNYWVLTVYQALIWGWRETDQGRNSGKGSEAHPLGVKFRSIPKLKKNLVIMIIFQCNVFVFYLFILFWPCHTACGILVPQPGIKPMPPAVEAWSRNHWTTGEVPNAIICLFVCLFIGRIGS